MLSFGFATAAGALFGAGRAGELPGLVGGMSQANAKLGAVHGFAGVLGGMKGNPVPLSPADPHAVLAAAR